MPNKKLCIVFLCCILSSCTLNLYKTQGSNDPNQSFFQKYQSALNTRNKSTFSPFKRKVEFGFTEITPDEKAVLLVNLLTAPSEGVAGDSLVLVLYPDIKINLAMENLNHLEYMESNSYNQATSVTETELVCTPSRTTTSQNSDGTTTTQTTPSTTETVTRTRNGNQTKYNTNPVILNRAKLHLTADNITAIKSYGIKRFEIPLEQFTLEIFPNRFQNRELKKRL